jgi:hypothetical protein
LVHRGDLFDTDSSSDGGDVVPDAETESAANPEAEGAEARLRVVSHMWNIGLDWEPDETRDVNSLVVRLRTIR